jgi:hypothetical protein
MKIKQVDVLRFSIFWIWIVTLLMIMVCFLETMIVHKLKVPDVRDSLTNLTSLVLPQISIMVAFFFGSSKSRQITKMSYQPSIAKLAIALSLVYHIVFWLCLWLGVCFGVFDNGLAANVNAVMLVVGIFSLLGLTPVAYFFANNSQ